MPISTISYLLIASFFVAIKIFLLKFQEMYFARMMVFMGIYHYTNAGTLPLILKNKTLRFTRADCLDDAAEVPFSSKHIDARFFYVSSWSLKSKEQSGQWYRYGDMSRGVRIGFSKSPFVWSTITEWFETKSFTHPNGSMRSVPDSFGFMIHEVEAPFDVTTLFGNGHMLVPDPSADSDKFGGAVSYVDDPEAEAAKFSRGDPASTTIFGRASDIARIKSKEWEDQEECRYVLMAFEGPKLSFASDPSKYRDALLKMMQERGKGHSNPSASLYIDIPISEKAFEEMEVILGPKISAADKDAVRDAVNAFAPSAHVKESVIKIR
ncbi:DUF2971 domain-containing protein [Xanthomonas campestris]|uniref:DUF2971 domain-containing protein n=1 Tax=Xanthomonas campestris TaxID=339 RepID=UPI0023675CDC|nr:DUF2971 domain-containing protein [Xanthomonas campestris]WDK83203.1 DUF2971 domain-containing protein [Xanthomonas campestris pv. campestris]WDK87247.1 DUF2971 domain-containing protein [Xanthomonas campestris pv. campestris]WDK91385.1 DUF2971 domain-containing protein [Xanthomonas campestris pv. campestris]WDL38307.1 DUF2971 domain-containing protein [Xanthomonas campestris pv. campestris]